MQMWAKFTSNTIILKLVSSVLQICGPLLAPSLVEHRFTLTALGIGKGLVTRTIDALNSSLASSERFVSVRKNIGCVFYEQLTGLYQYLDISFSDLPAAWKNRLFEGDGCELRTIQLCSMLAYMRSYVRIPLAIRDMGCLDSRLCGAIALGRQVATELSSEGNNQMEGRRHHSLLVHPDIAPPLPQSPSSVENPPRQDVRIKVARLILRLRPWLYCSTLLCNQSLHSAGKSYRRCAGCQVVGYCRTECQARSWRGEDLQTLGFGPADVMDLQHKSVCSVLAKLWNADGVKEIIKNADVRNHDAYHNALNIVNLWADVDVDEGEFYCVQSWIDILLNCVHKHPSTENCMYFEDDLGWEEYHSIIDQLIISGRGAPGVFSVARLAARYSVSTDFFRFLT